jgi:4-amino-4-deoxy-L-arabinose transferase-like glycosyltransferase
MPSLAIAPPTRVLAHARPALPLLSALCGFLFFYGLDAGELYRTESLRAIIAQEFLRSGNWVVPKLYDEPLLTKPPGSYAAIALASWPVGDVREWTARLPSAVAASCTVLLFYWYFHRQLGGNGGVIAAVMLPMSPLWLDKAPSAEIDVLQVAWVTAAILCLLRAIEEETSGALHARRSDGGHKARHSSLCWWLAALLCVAGGFLTKWTAPAFFYLTALPLLWRLGRLRLLLSRPHLIAAALAGGLCLTWVMAAIVLAGWNDFSYTVGREALLRLSPAHHERSYPWGEVVLHPFRILAATLPWSPFALLTLRPGFADLWDERGRRLLLALHCWTWPNLLLWTVVPDHASRHSFPLFPGIAGLAAMVWIAWLTGRMRWPLPKVSAGRAWFALLVVWLIAKVVFVQFIPSRNHARLPRVRGEQLAALVPAGHKLYLFRQRDEWLEGILFYFGRAHPSAGTPVKRLASAEQLPSSCEPMYCILDELEWRQWPADRPVETLARLSDEHGSSMIVARTRH